MSRRSRTPTGPESFEAIDRTIHEPARLSLLAHLVVLDEADFVYLQNETGMTRGNLGGHMTKLESVGYVTVEKTYRQRTPRTVLTDTSYCVRAHRQGPFSAPPVARADGRDRCDAPILLRHEHFP